MDLIKLDLNILDSHDLDVTSCVESANDGAGKGDERWRNLWLDQMKSDHLSCVNELVDSLKPNCKNLLIIGIGGSSLGAKALLNALGTGDINVFILDNIDSHTVLNTIVEIKSKDPTLKNTVVTVISKSGETAEIIALCMVAINKLSDATFVAITGKSSSLHAYAEGNSWSILPIPDGVGGRFSVLSPVGLFPAAMCGINIDELLTGAAEMDEQCMKLVNNPAAQLAEALVSSLLAKKSIHIMMPYCDRLVQFANWYVQLWAESLGKIDNNGNRVGPTPIAAAGATDQHSMLQLWREGPPDKVIGFVRVNETDTVLLGETPISKEQQWLTGQNLSSLLLAEQKATNNAMLDANQSTWTITLQKIDSNNIGQFIALWQDTVAIAGRLLCVNPYDQQGVELSKQLTRSSFSS
ncbi:MAG: hypothetical protein QF718_08535 [Phycisphaerales bacterium]|jgi:glucose-6-phosphate isomerase|nr:hypothetical protein [Phycisphaerales bacterium]